MSNKQLKGLLHGRFLKSLSNVEELIKLSKIMISTLLLEKFRSTKWVSNSRQILYSFPKIKLSPKLVRFDLHTPTVEGAHEIIWSINQGISTFKAVKLVSVIRFWSTGGGGREGAGGWTLEAKDFMGWINSKGL